jgi:putative nucleotidyltransferase with HDIG domain
VKASVEQRLRLAMDRLTPLPVLAGTAALVARLSDDPSSSVDELVSVVEQDEAFAPNLLAFANSARFVRPIRAQTIRQAVTAVGRRNLGRLALEAETYRFLERVPGAGRASRGQMHVHALEVAVVAAATAVRAGARQDSVHLAALLHDVGKLVLPIAFGEQATDAVGDRADAGAARAALERELLGVDHAYAGAVLAQRSGADDRVVEAIS